MKIKPVVAMFAMCLCIGEASAEISTFLDDATGGGVEVPADVGCFVQSRGFFGGNGKKSSLSEFFADNGLLVTDEKNSPCTITVSGNISVPKNTETHEGVNLVSVDLADQEPYRSQLLNAALVPPKPAQSESEQNKAPHTVGNDVGAVIGSHVGGVGTSIVFSMVGGLFDRESKKDPTEVEGVATISADIRYVDKQGNSYKEGLIVHAASTTAELPSALIRAAVKRIVGDIQVQPEIQDGHDLTAQSETPASEVR